MNINIWMKKVLAVIGSALMSLMIANVAYAAVQNIIAEVEFADPVSITVPVALQFGILDVGLLGSETIIIAPDSTVTGDIARITGGTQAASSMTVTATPATPLSIQVGNITNNTGYTLGTFMCKYNGGTDTACQAAPYLLTSVASAPLLIGATLFGTGFAGVGTFDGSFDVTVAYQ